MLLLYAQNIIIAFSALTESKSCPPSPSPSPGWSAWGAMSAGSPLWRFFSGSLCVKLPFSWDGRAWVFCAGNNCCSLDSVWYEAEGIKEAPRSPLLVLWSILLSHLRSLRPHTHLRYNSVCLSGASNLFMSLLRYTPLQNIYIYIISDHIWAFHQASGV